MACFLEVASLDLDSNGGNRVHPDDLYRSSLLVPVDWQRPPGTAQSYAEILMKLGKDEALEFPGPQCFMGAYDRKET